MLTFAGSIIADLIQFNPFLKIFTVELFSFGKAKEETSIQTLALTTVLRTPLHNVKSKCKKIKVAKL